MGDTSKGDSVVGGGVQPKTKRAISCGVLSLSFLFSLSRPTIDANELETIASQQSSVSKCIVSIVPPSERNERETTLGALALKDLKDKQKHVEPAGQVLPKPAGTCSGWTSAADIDKTIFFI